jgi:hypothetical protein
LLSAVDKEVRFGEGNHHESRLDRSILIKFTTRFSKDESRRALILRRKYACIWAHGDQFY